MFAILSRRIQIRVPISLAAHFSSVNSSSSSPSKNLRIKSQANSDPVLDLLKEYGFTNANISRLVTKWPGVLQSSPDKILLPKLEFFRSIGIPDAVAAQKLSTYSQLLQRSLENHLIPSYDYLRNLVQSDTKVLGVFKRAPLAFAVGWPKVIPSKIAILRNRGISDSSIVSLFVKQPSLFLLFSVEKLETFVNRAVEMGFEPSTNGFIGALQVFASMSDSTLKHKMEVFKACDWSESDVTAAFLRYPSCMTFSEAKIRRGIDFLVRTMGFTPPDVALRPVLLGLSLDCRVRPRWEVTKVLHSKGLLKKSISVPAISTSMIMGEAEFVKRYVTAYEEDIPWLLDLYRGKLTLSQMGLDQVVMPK